MESKVKVIVAGTRTFDDWTYFWKTLDGLLRKLSPEEVQIVSGGAKGADAFAQTYASVNEMDFKEFPADWDAADYGDLLIAFWDGSSRGTKDMIDNAMDNNLNTHIMFF